MSLHHAAKHLASKGRNGDTTLVHMTEGEVAGLQALAKRHGTSLTINPHTGLPEAFGLKQLLPMAAGAALVASGVGAPLAAGIVGGGTFLATGSLQQGLMAGLGAYGGAGLMGGVTAAGTQEVAGQKLAEEAAKNQAENVLAQQAATVEATNAAQAANLGAPGVYAPPSTSTTGMFDEAARDVVSNSADMSYITPANQIPPSTYGATANADQLAAAKANTGFTDLASKGFSSLGTETGRTAALQGMGGGMGAAKYGLAAAAPIIADKMTPEQYVPPEIKGDADMGQRYAFESGYDNAIPGRTGPASYRQISNEEARKLYGFAEGGEVGYPGEPVVRMADGGSAGYTGNVGDYSAADAAAARSGYGLGINYSGYDTPVNQGIVAIVPSKPRAPATSAATQTQGLRYDPVSGTYIGSGTDAPYLGGGQYGKTQAELDAEAKAAEEIESRKPWQMNYAVGGGAQGGVMPNDLHYAQGGISTLGGYSDGGRLLKGPGDGMSDNIPATIGRKQPARLADGEFVVPADVVSHLGNGSTDAGAKQLYKMMDKIRQARTGRKAQGKQINPNKFVPA